MRSNSLPDFGSMRFLDWLNLRPQLVWVYEGPPGSLRNTFCKGELTAWLLQRGQVLWTGHKEPVTSTTNRAQWVFPPPAARNAAEFWFSPDALILSIRLHVRWPDDRPLFSHAHPLSVRAVQVPGLESAARRLLTFIAGDLGLHGKQLARQQIDWRSYLRIEHLSLDFLAAYTDALLAIGAQPTRLGETRDRVAEAKQIIHRAAPQHPLSERALATQVGLSVSQLNRLFVAEAGMTPRAYIERLRLDRAQRLLRSTSMPIKQVAFELGFKHAANFSNWFHRQANLYPLAYRQQS